MTTSALITNAWVKAQGEIPTFIAGSDDYNYLLNLANFYIDQWADEEGVDWFSLYDPTYSLGTVTATDSFDIDTDEVRKISQELGDTVRITWTNGTNYTDYNVVSADELKNYPYDNVCARVGTTLRFGQAFKTTDAEYGGTLTIPVFLFPDHLVNANDVVPVDKPNWLVSVVAYDVVLHDILRKDIAGNLINEANAIMERMKSDNEGQLKVMGTPWTPFSGDSAWSGNYNGYGQS